MYLFDCGFSIWGSICLDQYTIITDGVVVLQDTYWNELLYNLHKNVILCNYC